MKIPIVPIDVNTPQAPIYPIVGGQAEGQLVAMHSIQSGINQVMQDVGEFRARIKAGDDEIRARQTAIDVQKEYEDKIAQLRLNPNPDTYIADSRNIFSDITKSKLDQISDRDLRHRAGPRRHPGG